MPPYGLRDGEEVAERTEDRSKRATKFQFWFNLEKTERNYEDPVFDPAPPCRGGHIMPRVRSSDGHPRTDLGVDH